jgi:hypothetical protein
MNPIIAKARALLEGRERQEAEAKLWREERTEELLAAETDALLAKSTTATIKQRDYGDTIYKTRDDALVQPQQQQQPMVGRPMAPELQQAWNEWCDSRILHHIAEFNNRDLMKHFEEYSEIVGEEVDRIAQSIIKERASKIILYDPGKALEKEIEKAVTPLRAEIATLKKQLVELRKKKS